MRLRNVRKADVKDVCKTNKSCWPGFNVSEEYKKAMLKRPIDFFVNTIAENLKDPNKKMLVADDGKVVAYVVARADGKRGEIKTILVSPKNQRQGLGRKLLKAVLKRFPNVERWKVCTLHNNERTKHFYKKIGFRVKRYRESEYYGFKVREAVLFADRETVIASLR